MSIYIISQKYVRELIPSFTLYLHMSITFWHRSAFGLLRILSCIVLMRMRNWYHTMSYQLISKRNNSNNWMAISYWKPTILLRGDGFIQYKLCYINSCKNILVCNVQWKFRFSTYFRCWSYGLHASITRKFLLSDINVVITSHVHHIYITCTYSCHGICLSPSTSFRYILGDSLVAKKIQRVIHTTTIELNIGNTMVILHTTYQLMDDGGEIQL